MNKFNYKHLIGFIAVCLIGFFIPFITKTKDETLNSVISTALTAVSTIVAIITLIVGVILFDKFGINAKFKERQLDIVLNLISELKLINLTVSNGDFIYVNYMRKCINLETLLINHHIDLYHKDKTKVLLLPSNFENLLNPIDKLLKNAWMPQEIKSKTEFLNIYLGKPVEKIDYSIHVSLDINNYGEAPWLETVPKLTFEMFTINLSNLITTTLLWIKQHSNINIDFDIIDEKR
jgi:hypothetical protein